jgi:hypothetical protein
VLGVLEGLLSSGAETEAEAVAVERLEALTATCAPQAVALQPCRPAQVTGAGGQGETTS